jgi:hypothetical protein
VMDTNGTLAPTLPGETTHMATLDAPISLSHSGQAPHQSYFEPAQHRVQVPAATTGQEPQPMAPGYMMEQAPYPSYVGPALSKGQQYSNRYLGYKSQQVIMVLKCYNRFVEIILYTYLHK